MSITTHMATGCANFSHPTYDELAAMCNHIGEFIHYNASAIGKIDTIVGVTRGGLVPASELSHKLNIPMVAVQYSSKSGAGDDKNHGNKLPEINGDNILIVDDIADTGFTLKEMTEIYEIKGKNVFTAVLYFKDHGDNTVFVPDVWAMKISKNFGWIHFPWEHN